MTDLFLAWDKYLSAALSAHEFVDTRRPESKGTALKFGPEFFDYHLTAGHDLLVQCQGRVGALNSALGSYELWEIFKP